MRAPEMGDLAKLRSIKESPEIKILNLLIVSVQTVLIETRQKAVINEVRQ